MINYDDALNQLRAAGLLLDRDRHGKPLIVGTTTPQRWRGRRVTSTASRC